MNGEENKIVSRGRMVLGRCRVRSFSGDARYTEMSLFTGSIYCVALKFTQGKLYND